MLCAIFENYKMHFMTLLLSKYINQKSKSPFIKKIRLHNNYYCIKLKKNKYYAYSAISKLWYTRLTARECVCVRRNSV